MILIDRKRIPIPKVLDRERSEKADREYFRAKEFYLLPQEERLQRRFAFTLYKHAEVREALVELFHGKCAFCESKYARTAPTDIMHFRPKGGVVDAQPALPDHYWWLAADWANLYPSCPNCNRMQRHQVGEEKVATGKGGRFPILGERAPLEGGAEELAAELPLLLDPCDSNDDPEGHLLYDESGMVFSETERGQASIEIYGLNRNELVEARHNTWLQADSQFQKLLQEAEFGNIDLQEMLEDFTADQVEYAGLRRMYLNMRSTDISAALKADFSKIERRRVSKTRAARAKRSFRAYQRDQENFSLADEDSSATYLSRRRLVESVEIRNIKGIGHVKIDFTRSEHAGTPWTMLLGENATCKSTVLQAIALALVGEQYLHQVVEQRRIRIGDFVRRSARDGEGWIKVQLEGFSKPHHVTIRKEGSVEFHNHRQPQILLLGYGATRLMPLKHEQAGYGTAYARVDNLFDPFTPLVNAENWLLQSDPTRFGVTARQLKGLLSLKPHEDLYRENDDVFAQIYGNRVPLHDLSQGYQTVLALAADILEVVLNHWPTPESAEGVVLLDELGSHLHPTWKMRFVGDLRTFFPGLQFIATTHDPLCLRGLADGEITVMQRGPRGGISTLKDPPSVQGLRVDQLLTSEHFGLASTVDPDIERWTSEYYALLRKRHQTSGEQLKMRELQGKINQKQSLGHTERERLMLEEIDRYLAMRTPEDANKQKAKMRARIARIWKQA